jgi:hypothetical protein
MTTMFDHFGSSYAAGFISILVLALASVTRFGVHLRGTWHVIYVVSAGAALYFNVLVGVVGALSQTEPSVLLIQFAVVLPFVATTVVIVKRLCHGASADRALSLQNTEQVPVKSRTVVDNDIPFNKVK